MGEKRWNLGLWGRDIRRWGRWRKRPLTLLHAGDRDCSSLLKESLSGLLLMDPRRTFFPRILTEYSGLSTNPHSEHWGPEISMEALRESFLLLTFQMSSYKRATSDEEELIDTTPDISYQSPTMQVRDFSCSLILCSFSFTYYYWLLLDKVQKVKLYFLLTRFLNITTFCLVFVKS